jgi:hypothetical protein
MHVSCPKESYVFFQTKETADLKKILINSNPSGKINVKQFISKIT